MDKEKHKDDFVSLFMQGVLSVMSYPFIFGHSDIKGLTVRRVLRSDKLVEEMGREGIGRHFAKVGEMLSDAYRQEAERLGVKYE